MPTPRRKPTRPTHAIAFSVASAPTTLSRPEVSLFQSSLPSNPTVEDLFSFLSTIALKDPSLSTALFHLSSLSATPSPTTPSTTTTPSNLTLVYATLRTLATTDPSATLPFRRAAEDAAFLLFTAAAGTPSATTLSLTTWHTFLGRVCTAIGGPDSPPCPATTARTRAAWRYAAGMRGYFSRRRGGGDFVLDFPRLLVALRVFDAGLVAVLRAVGVVVTAAVYVALNGKSAPLPKLFLPDVDAHATFLSQFLMVSLQRVAEVQQQQQQQQQLPPTITSDNHANRRIETANPTDNTTAAINPPTTSGGDGNNDDDEDGPPTNQPISANTLSDNTQSTFTSVTVSDLTRRGSSFRDNDPFHSIDDPVHSLDNLPSPPTTPRSPTQTSLIRRRQQSGGSRGGKTPFHIDYSSLTLGEKIGEGAYGQVYKGTFLLSPVAIKVFHVHLQDNPLANGPRLSEDEEQDPGQLDRMSTLAAIRRFATTNSVRKYHDFVREVEMMSVVRHPNLVLYMGACGDPFTPLCIVSELFTGGSLHDFLHDDRTFTPNAYTTVTFALNIARGMYYLHSSDPSILHRDLKARNVLLSGRKETDGVPHVVICDFGLCQLFSEGAATDDGGGINGGGGGADGSGRGHIGTVAYMSPEVIRGETFEKADDVYSFGILMHEIVSGCVPYEGMRAMQVAFQVANQGLRPDAKDGLTGDGGGEGDAEVNDEFRKLMRECWSERRSERPPFDAIIARLERVAQTVGGT